MLFSDNVYTDNNIIHGGIYMGIDSMDAAGVSYSKSQDLNNSTKELTINTNDKKTNIEEIKRTGSDLDSVNISQLSPFEKRDLPVSEKLVIEAIQKANKAISGGNRRFEFSIHAKTKEIMVKVIDNDTGDVLKEIPSEKTLDMVAKLWEMSGITVDERR